MIEAELSRRIESPDFTKAVMGRLGYMRVSPAALRRRRHARWMRRLATAACLSLALFAGLFMHRQSADSRRPMGPTIPAALRDSIESTGAQFDRTIESIGLFNILQQRGAEHLEQQESQPASDVVRPTRRELQRGNQPPFRWVRGLSHDRSLVA